MGFLELCRNVSAGAELAMARPPASTRAPAAPARVVAGFTRQQQAVQAMSRNYQAAQDNRNTFGMAAIPMSPDSLTQRTMRKLRARSRQEAAINDFAKRFLQILDNNIVGPRGIVLRGQFLNPDGKHDQQAAAAVETAWERWGMYGACDTTNGLSWLDVQSLTLRTAAVDGEVLIRLVVDTGKRGGPYFLRLEMIDPELLNVDDFRELRTGNKVRQGIEFNQQNQPVAYWIMDPATDYLGAGYRGRDAVRIPAENMLHIFDPERVGQRRGLPWTATSLMRLAVLEGMEDAALIAARVGASKVGVFTREPGASQWQGEGGNATTGELFMEAVAGTFTELPPGVSLDSWDPAYPNGEFGPFTKAVLRGIASGLGVPYTSLSSDLEGVNYSSIRAGMLEARELYKRRQEWLISRLLRPIYEKWLTLNLYGGLLLLPNGSPLPARKLDKFLQVEFQPPRWEWVDPLKEYQAQELAIARGTMTESESIRARGRDPEAVWQERSRELQRKRELGLPMGPDMPQLLTPAPPASDSNAEE